MFLFVPMAKLGDPAPAGSSSKLHSNSSQQTHAALLSMHPKCPMQNDWRSSAFLHRGGFTK